MDTFSWKIVWIRDGITIGTGEIPLSMRSVPLFPVITLYREGDEIELLEWNALFDYVNLLDLLYALLNNNWMDNFTVWKIGKTLEDFNSVMEKLVQYQN